MKSIVFLMAVLLGICQLNAAVPSAINYQGRLTDSTGLPQPGIKTISLKIYSSATDGVQLYFENMGNVTIDAKGIYGFQFGATGAGTPPDLASVLATSTEQWLELTVDGVVQAPRQKILAVPFALTAGTLPDGAVSSAMIADGAVGLSKITGLGSAATTDASAYATAAQGTLASNAIPSTRTINGVDLSANRTLADLGLGTAATLPAAFVDIRKHGAVSGQLCDTAIANAITAAVAAGHRTVYFPAGSWRISAPIAVNVAQLRFLGEAGAGIVQTTSNHGIELSGTYGAARDFRISGIGISGPGWAIDKAGIKWSNGGTYLGDTFTIENCTVVQFGNALELGNVNKVIVRNFSSIGCRVGARLASTQTWMFEDCRMTGGTAGTPMADSACFNLSGTMFSGIVTGGEFMGANIQRFADIASGRIEVYSANIEAPESNQTINCTTSGPKHIGLIACRIAENYTGTMALISADCTGNAGIPTLNVSGLQGYTGYPQIELWGGAFIGPILTGDPIFCSFAATQGGPPLARSGGQFQPGMRQCRGVANLPLSGASMAVLVGNEVEVNDKFPDTWAMNPVMRYLNHYTGTYQRSSTLNDMLSRVLFVSWSDTATVGTIETDIMNDVNPLSPYNTRSYGFPLPSGAFATWGESVTVKSHGIFAANANSKNLKVILGGTGRTAITLDFGSLTSNGEAWTVEIEMVAGYTTGNAIKVLATLRTNTVTRVLEGASSASSSASPALLRMTGTGVANGDIVLRSAKAVWTRAPSRF